MLLSRTLGGGDLDPTIASNLPNHSRPWMVGSTSSIPGFLGESSLGLLSPCSSFPGSTSSVPALVVEERLDERDRTVREIPPPPTPKFWRQFNTIPISILRFFRGALSRYSFFFKKKRRSVINCKICINCHRHCHSFSRDAQYPARTGSGSPL